MLVAANASPMLHARTIKRILLPKLNPFLDLVILSPCYQFISVDLYVFSEFFCFCTKFNRFNLQSSLSDINSIRKGSSRLIAINSSLVRILAGLLTALLIAFHLGFHHGIRFHVSVPRLVWPGVDKTLFIKLLLFISDKSERN
jgi:hypothetical protein